MKTEDIQSKVIEVIRRKRSAVHIDGETRIAEDIGLDSLDWIELVYDLEEELEITVDVQFPSNNRPSTVDDVVEFLRPFM